MSTHSTRDTLRRRWLGLFVSALAASLVLVVGPAALAQEADNVVGPMANSVDMRDPSHPDAVIFVGESNAPDVAVKVNDVGATDVRATLAWTSGHQLRNVIVFDNSDKNSDSLDALKAEAIDYVTDLAPGEKVALVTSGATGRLLVPFTSDSNRLASAISGLESGGPLRLWDGLAVAIDQLETVDGDGVVPSATILAAGGDDGSDARYSVQRGGLLNLNALVHVVGVDLRGLDVAELRELVRQNGGSMYLADSSAAVSRSARGLDAAVRGVWSVTFQSDNLDAGTDLELTINGTTLEIGFVPGSVATQGALVRGESAGGGGISLLSGNQGLILGIVLGAAAIGMAALAVGLLFNQEESALSSMLSAYRDGSTEDADEGVSLANNAIFQRAVELTESFAEKQGLLARTEEQLERANLPFKAAEALTFYAASVVVSLLLAVLLRSNLIIAGLILVVGIVLPRIVIKVMGARRRKKFVGQLSDTLTLLAGTLKAGYSFMQGLETIARETEDPMGEELRRVVTEAQLGLPVEDALDHSGERMQSDNYSWAIMAVKIQREVGGNLSELLMTVAETMTARDRLKREVAALTAEGKISAIVLGILPAGLGVVMAMINPGYVAVLLDETIGRIMLGTAIVAMLVGFLWMKKIITIEI